MRVIRYRFIWSMMVVRFGKVITPVRAKSGESCTTLDVDAENDIFPVDSHNLMVWEWLPCITVVVEEDSKRLILRTSRRMWTVVALDIRCIYIWIYLLLQPPQVEDSYVLHFMEPFEECTVEIYVAEDAASTFLTKLFPQVPTLLLTLTSYPTSELDLGLMEHFTSITHPYLCLSLIWRRLIYSPLLAATHPPSTSSLPTPQLQRDRTHHVDVSETNSHPTIFILLPNSMFIN